MSTTDDATGLAIPPISIIEPSAEIGVGVQFMLRPFVKTETGKWRGGSKGIWWVGIGARRWRQGRLRVEMRSSVKPGNEKSRAEMSFRKGE